MEVFWLSVVAAAAALVGGWAAVSSRSRLNLTLGFTAGMIIGLVAFDLLPEIFRTVSSQKLDPVWPMAALVVGFLIFHIIEKFILIHHGSEEKYGPHQHPAVGVAGAVALSGHSFFDGLSIGVGFQVNSAVGVAVAIAVIGHRFADGFNTTNVMLHHQNRPSRAKSMLLVASAMPILGGLASLMFNLPAGTLAVYLGFFAGFMLYIGSGDILPQAHSKGSSYKTILMTIVGVVFIFVVTRLS